MNFSIKRFFSKTKNLNDRFCRNAYYANRLKFYYKTPSDGFSEDEILYIKKKLAPQQKKPPYCPYCCDEKKIKFTDSEGNEVVKICSKCD